jgi:hypothetical protein
MRTELDRPQTRADALRATTLNPDTTGGCHRAVAIEHGAELRLTLWVRRSLKGECVILQLRDGNWNPHQAGRRIAAASWWRAAAHRVAPRSHSLVIARHRPMMNIPNAVINSSPKFTCIFEELA